MGRAPVVAHPPARLQASTRCGTTGQDAQTDLEQ